MKYLALLLIGFLVCSFGGKNAPGENVRSELQWSLCETSLDNISKKLNLPILKKFNRQTYYFDTAEKDLHKNKYAIRLLKENNKFSSILKMDYNDPREIPDFIPPSMKCEKNYYRDDQFLACKVTYKKATLEKPLSETQEDYLKEKLKKDISMIRLVSFGRFEGLHMKLKYQAQDKKNLTFNLSEVKGKSHTLELSVNVSREKDAVYFQEISGVLASKHIELCPEQKGHRPPILDL